MKKTIKDLRITEDNRFEFNKNGWTLVDLQLSKELIRDSVKGLKKMKYLSIKNDFKPRRIYHDHLFTFNIAAIELPFNNQICDENVKNFFKEAKIGSLVRTLMDWDEPLCDLARLFCMGNYNYRGNWHRDYESDLEKIHQDSEVRNVVLVGIYFLPQKGFRILKKDFEFNGINSIVKDKKIDKAIRSFPFPLSPPDDSYHIIDGVAGKALFFDPLLLHQGSNYGNRLDFHMKFTKSNQTYNSNSFQDFSVIKILEEDYKLPSENYSSTDNIDQIPFTKRPSLLERFVNTADYRFFLKKFLKNKSLNNSESFKLIKKYGWELDFLSNTFLQK